MRKPSLTRTSLLLLSLIFITLLLFHGRVLRTTLSFYLETQMYPKLNYIFFPKPESKLRSLKRQFCPFGVDKGNVINKIDLKKCSQIADETLSDLEIEKEVRIEYHVDTLLESNDSYFSNCEDYFSHYCHFDKLQPVNEFEENFPLAFTFLIYRNFAQFEQLFRSVYRRHNFYCIHLDAKAELTMRNKVRLINEIHPKKFLCKMRKKCFYFHFIFKSAFS